MKRIYSMARHRFMETKAQPATTKYPQVGFQCFVDMKLVFEKQIFVGSSSVKSCLVLAGHYARNDKKTGTYHD